MCSSRKKFIPTPLKVIGNSQVGGRVLKAKPAFPGGRGLQNKIPYMGGVWIFSGTVQCQKHLLWSQIIINCFFSPFAVCDCIKG